MDYQKIILDMMNRIVILEEKVNVLETKQASLDEKSFKIKKSESSSSAQTRDTTKYLMEGKLYGKSRLVLATIYSYIRNNPNTTGTELLTTFDKSLQGSLGVIRKLDDVRSSITDYEKRFFTKPEEVLVLSDGKYVVCTQWGIGNIYRFITRAKELGYTIRETV